MKVLRFVACAVTIVGKFIRTVGTVNIHFLHSPRESISRPSFFRHARRPATPPKRIGKFEKGIYLALRRIRRGKVASPGNICFSVSLSSVLTHAPPVIVYMLKFPHLAIGFCSVIRRSLVGTP